jgi:hypothetical protein
MLIERAIVVSLMIVATHISMEKDMWLEWLQCFLSKLVPESSVWSKPLYNCVGCMASVWGVLYYSLTALTPYFGYSLMEMVIVCIICIPLNFVFIKLS